MRKGTTGRRSTPWDDMNDDDKTPIQRFLSDRYKAHFAMNPPSDHLEKVELLLNHAIMTRKTLRYRAFYNVF